MGWQADLFHRSGYDVWRMGLSFSLIPSVLNIQRTTPPAAREEEGRRVTLGADACLSAVRYFIGL